MTAYRIAACVLLPLALLGACARTEVAAPAAVQAATAGQDNREIVLPAAILIGLVLWGRS